MGIYSNSSSVINYFILFAELRIINHGSKVIMLVCNDIDKLNQTFTNLFVFGIPIFAYILNLILLSTNNKGYVVIQIFML